MSKTLRFVCITGFLWSVCAFSQTTAGTITGLVTDSSGAVVTGAEVDVTNTGTGVLRTARSSDNGIFLVPDLSPGIYDVAVKRQGYATENRENIQLEVNQSVTLDFKLGVSSTMQTVTVTGAAPLLNTTSATLSTVVDHDAVVGLPLNGREFTQLTLLTPGAAPSVTGQQGTFTISLGAGGISPSMNGQQGYENNYTMDGVLNNAIYTDIWAIAPPPDAIQEFNVQAHITDAQFAVSSGANINVVTRSGTNTFHGAVWEFLRNDALDTQTFPATARLPYHQNQYGLYFGGPVLVPHLIDGRNNTWFSIYWEGFRSAQTQTELASTLTPDMISGNFSAELGKTSIGTDCNGQPEYADELYDPTTSVADSCHPGEFLRTPFKYNGALNVLPPGRLNSVSQTIIAKYYPSPNLNVAEGVLPNYQFPGATDIASDVSGIRIDHQFTQNDIAFARFNRSNAHRTSPEALPTYYSLLSNYSQQAALGYTHIFSPKTLLNFRYGYTYVNDLDGDEPAGEAFANSVNFLQAVPVHDGIAEGPAVTIANGFSGVSQTIYPLGPLETMDYHVDLTKLIGHHALGIGAVYEHLRAYDDGWRGIPAFAQNGTAQDGLAGPTGYGPASFMLGVLDSYSGWIGNTGVGQTANWYGLYAQDQWQLTRRLVLTAGLRWDYVSPPNFHKVVSAFDPLNGTFVVTGPVSGYTGKTGPSGFYNPQYNGYEPRFGITYAATDKIVVHSAFAMLDDHNNTLVQENQSLRLSWPTANATSLTSLDLGLPTTLINNLPAASSILASLQPVPSYAGDPNNRIPYSLQYNFGVEQQLSNSMTLKLDYVGSVNRHQYFDPTANTALYPGPGTVKSRALYPQYGTFAFYWNEMPTSYNALQAQVHKSMSSGLFFLASYTWSKSLDWSDPYASVGNIYKLNGEWGPSTLNFKHIFVLSGVYTLPFGRGKMFLGSADRLVEAIAGNWNIGSIISLHSGGPFNVVTGADIANIGNSDQRPNRTGVSPYAAHQTYNNWLNEAAFIDPASYTFGNERRDDLTGPAYKDVDLNTAKDFPLVKSTILQFRGEFFNAFNHTNYGNPNATLSSSAFGKITSASPGREIQFALKLVF